MRFEVKMFDKMVDTNYNKEARETTTITLFANSKEHAFRLAKFRYPNHTILTVKEN